MKCPKCNANNLDDANFCFSCGADMHVASEDSHIPANEIDKDSFGNKSKSASASIKHKRLLIFSCLAIAFIMVIAALFVLWGIHSSHKNAINDYNTGNFETAIEYFGSLLHQIKRNENKIAINNLIL